MYIAAAELCLFVAIAPLSGQHRVEPRQIYERTMAIVSMTGT